MLSKYIIFSVKYFKKCISMSFMRPNFFANLLSPLFLTQLYGVARPKLLELVLPIDYVAQV